MNVNKGPYALTVNYEDASLTWDWCYDALYFKYGDERYIRLSLGEKCVENEIHKITPEMERTFKLMCFTALDSCSQITSDERIVRTRARILEQINLFIK